MTDRHNIRGIVFDLDGVLLQSSACHRAAFEAVLRPLGVTDFDYRRYAGWRTADAIEDTLRGTGRLPDANTIAMLADAKSRLARVKLAASQPVPADCLPVLRQLSDCYRLALASSGSRRSVELFLETNSCRPLFRCVLSGEDVQRAKPDPEIYQKAFEALELQSSECVVVEDAVAGIAAARAAGAAVIGIVGTYPEEALREAGASRTVSTLSELPALLESGL